MKLASLCLGIATVLSALATSTHAQDVSVSGKGKPGYCADSTKCAASYSCVSVQTTRAGVTDVKQCLPSSTASTPVCTGVAPGLCPSFSTTWGTAFREISSVCAYIAPDASGGKCITDPAKANATKGGLECLFVQDPKNKTAQIGVIYGCVDFDGKRLLFEQDSASDRLASKFNYSSVIADSCVNPKNPSGSSFVCSSQGTCAPKSAGSMDYACACNVGFSGTYCEKIVNNKCYNDGVCGGGSCDLTTNECTNCTAGTLGDKCAQCDPTFDSSKVCSGHGKCVASSGTSTLGAADGSMASNASSNTTRMLAAASQYQCECDVGYSDVHCGVMVSSSTGTKKTTTTAPTTGSSAASIVYSVVGVALATVVVTLAH